jgi:cardiolipin synthase
MLHAKTAVIDGIWSTVGSSNLDYLSFLHDDEANATIVGSDFGQQMENLFQLDLNHAQPIELGKWKRRSAWERIKERFLSLFKYWM